MGKLSDAQIEKLNRALAADYTTRQAAKIAQCGTETARKHRKRQPGYRPGASYKLTEEQRQEILKRVAARTETGEKLVSIANDFGVTESYISHLRKRRG